MQMTRFIALLICAFVVLAIPATAGAQIKTTTTEYGSYTIRR